MKRKNKEKTKFCPFIEERCRGEECALYHDKCEECDLHLLVYNSYKLNLYADRFFTEKLGEL